MTDQIPVNQISPKDGQASRASLRAIDHHLLDGVSVSVEANIGRTSMTIEALMALKAGSVVTLETSIADHAELFLDGSLVARGEIVAVGDRFGIRIIDIAERD